MNALTRRQFVKRAGAATAGAAVLGGTTVAIARQREFDPADWVRRAEAMGILPLYESAPNGFHWVGKRGVTITYDDPHATGRGFTRKLLPEIERLFDEIRATSNEKRINRLRLEIWLHDNGYTLARQKARI